MIEIAHQCLYFSLAAKTAAPSRPASALRITFTGIAASIASSGGLARNARMNVPVVSAGRIFGAMPPPTNSAAGRHRPQREVARLRAVGLDEHVERFDAAGAAPLERGRRDRRRRVGIVEVDVGRARVAAMRDRMDVEEAAAGDDVLDVGAAVALR